MGIVCNIFNNIFPLNSFIIKRKKQNTEKERNATRKKRERNVAFVVNAYIRIHAIRAMVVLRIAVFFAVELLTFCGFKEHSKPQHKQIIKQQQLRQR